LIAFDLLVINFI